MRVILLLPPLSPSPLCIHSLQPAITKSKPGSKYNKLFQRFQSIFRCFPIIMPSCKMPTVNTRNRSHEVRIHGGMRITETLFGHRKPRVNLAFQENPNYQPFLLLELLQDMGMGLNRIVLECEKPSNNNKIKIIDEPIWTLKWVMGVKKEAPDDDLNVMQLLHADL
ncbi:Protein MIZU-KUSSEI 1 [Glycine soja]